jgi:sulfite exporter TauE/SafE/copper chaperone CopZ/plastocyanin domain-containing protein
MGASIKRAQLHIIGMTCISCQNKIENKLSNTEGIISVKVSYSNNSAYIVYDNDIITLNDITTVIQKLDYTVLKNNEHKASKTKKSFGFLIMIVSLYWILQQFGILNLLAPSQLVDTNMSYGMLFIIGLLTSVHCIAMCGGINLSQCIPSNETSRENSNILSTLKPTFLYNLGRVISYTLVGFIVGGLGSVITFTNTVQGVLKLIAGIFMIIMGANMLDIFPWLRKLNPRMPSFIAKRISKKKSSSKSPLIVGLLNGFMPCGPLQAMQIYALSTGNPFSGAFSMLLFSLGTVPLMFGLGALSTALGKKITNKIMSAGAVLVVVLGMSMFSQGLNLSGMFFPPIFADSSSSKSDTPDNDIEVDNGVQIVKSTLSSGRYPAITVIEGMPVKWIIDAPKGSINGCNNRIFIPEYDIEYQFITGENIIEFTPSKTGTFSYSCWMGMIRSRIKVVDSNSEIETGSDDSGQDNAFVNIIPKDPTPANYIIPTENIAIATLNDNLQKVAIELTDDGFKPAIIVIQANIETEWIIYNSSSNESNYKIIIPFYSALAPLVEGENPLYLTPIADFDFSNGDNTFYGYVKVVEDINNIDIDAIKKEVAGFKTLIWLPETFGGNSGAPSCH